MNSNLDKRPMHRFRHEGRNNRTKFNVPKIDSVFEINDYICRYKIMLNNHRDLKN